MTSHLAFSLHYAGIAAGLSYGSNQPFILYRFGPTLHIKESFDDKTHRAKTIWLKATSTCFFLISLSLSLSK